MCGKSADNTWSLVFSLPAIMLNIILLFVIHEIPLAVLSTKYFSLYIFAILGSAAIIYILFSNRVYASHIDVLVILFFIYIIFFNLGDVVRGLDNKKLIVFANSMIIYFSIRLLKTYSTGHLAYVLVLSSIYVFAISNCVIVVLQKLNLFSSYNPAFEITGTFFHPAPLAGYLSCVLPLSLYTYYILRHGKRHISGLLKHLGTLSLITSVSILFALPSLNSRSAAVGAIAGICFLLFSAGLRKFYKWSRPTKLVLISSLVLATIIFGITIYTIRIDSANGRVLVWKIASGIIADKPLHGHGLDSFKRMYPDYQINYFEQDLNSEKEVALSDEVTTAFNELIQLLCETGVLGVIILLLIIVKIFETRDSNSKINENQVVPDILNKGTKSAITSFITFSFFSYPFSTVELTVLFFMFLAMTNPWSPKEFKSNSMQTSYRTLLLIISCMVLGLSFYGFQQFRGYRHWYQALNQGNYDKAIQHFEIAKKALWHNGVFASTYANFQHRQGYPGSVIEILRKKTGKSYDDLMLLAVCHRELGQVRLSLDYYNKAHYLLPHRFRPLAEQLELYEKFNNSEMVKEIAKKIVDMEIKIPSAEVDRIREIAKGKLNGEL